MTSPQTSPSEYIEVPRMISQVSSWWVSVGVNPPICQFCRGSKSRGSQIFSRFSFIIQADDLHQPPTPNCDPWLRELIVEPGHLW